MRSLGAAFLCAARVLLPMTGEAAGSVQRPDGSELTSAEIDREAGRLMAARKVPGLTIALIENGEKLDFKFDPGTRYAYSGEGINLLQFVLEHGLGLELGREMQRRVFDRFGMTRTSMTWRADFSPNYADGYDEHGKCEPHDHREAVRAAGSMDTTIKDFSKFLAGFLRGEGISAAAREEMLRPQIAIQSAHQFPTLAPAENPANREIALSGGLGCILFHGPLGSTFYKGGHNEWTDNLALGLPAKKRGLLLMSNSVLAETIYPALVKFLWGETGLPWSWEYNAPELPPPLTLDHPGNVLQAREIVGCSRSL